jgi:hypothetical protein
LQSDYFGLELLGALANHDSDVPQPAGAKDAEMSRQQAAALEL